MPAAWLRLCLAAVLMVTTGQVLFAPMEASAAAPPSAPSVSPTSPYVGHSFTVKGTVPGRFARTVRLQTWNGKAYVTRATKRSSSAGAYAFTHAAAESSVRVRAVVSAGRHKGRSYPQVATAPRVVTQRAGSLTMIAPGVGKERTALAVDATMTPATAGRSIYLERLVDETWKVESRTTSTSTGQEQLRFTLPRSPATQQYRVRVPAFGLRPALISAPSDVQVSPWESVPRVTIETEGGVEIVSGSEYVRGIMTIDPRDSGIHASSHAGRFRVRGNSTSWIRTKLPYKIKLDKKSAVAGFPASKDWALLANFYDRSLLRNDTAFEAARRIGMPWSPRMQFAEVIVNGRPQGLYQLGENVEKAKDRVDLPEDGVLLEADQWETDGPLFTTSRGLKIALKDPNDGGESLTSDVAAGVQAAEDALYSEEFTDRDLGYRAHLDVDSFVDWYLVNELMKNVDSTFTASVWMSWSGGRVAMAAPWDFDFSAGNRSNFGHPDPTGWFLRRSWWSEEVARPGTMMPGPEGHWLVRLMKDPWFEQRVKDRWREVVPGLRGLPGYVVRQAAAIDTAATRNFTPLEEGGVGHQIGPSWIDDNPSHVFRGSWPAETAALTDWLGRRITWMDAQLGQRGESGSP